MTIKAGTIAICNRCNQKSATPKDCEAVKDSARMYRLTSMCTLACGHIDAHWVAVSDFLEVPA